MKILATIALFVLLILPLTTKEKSLKRMYVSAKDVVIKETPDLEAEEVGSLELGDYPLVVSYVSQKGKTKTKQQEWVKIEYETTGYILLSQLSEEPPFLLDQSELNEVAKYNFKRFTSLFEHYSTRVPSEGLDAFETETYQKLIKDLQKLSKLPILKNKNLEGAFKTWFLQNNKQIESRLDRGDCTFQYEEVANADKGCTDYKISLIVALKSKTNGSERALVESFGDQYCITAYQNGNDTCGRSKVGYSIYQSLR